MLPSHPNTKCDLYAKYYQSLAFHTTGNLQ